jgi:hypothetical protein
MPKGKPTTAQIVLMASGAVTLLFSFFHFYKFGNTGISAWGSGVFPIATYVAIFGVIVAGETAARVFAGVKLPDEILGFSWRQIHLILSGVAALLMLGFLIQNKHGLDLGIGFFFMLIGAAGLLAGSIMETREPASSAPGPGTTPPTPF